MSMKANLILDPNDSLIFGKIKDCWSSIMTWEKSDILCSSNGLKVLALLYLCVFVLFLWNTIPLFKRNSKGRISNRNTAFIYFAFWVFFSGVLLYYIGYDYGGTGKNFLTLLLRSVLSSFEMFLSKSNLIGIADNCKGDATYMFFFAVTHASALTVSTLFAVLCFGKRILYWVKRIKWKYIKTSSATNVFWGLNERSYILAHDIQKNSSKGERFVFIDFPLQETSPSKGQSFSGILGLFSYKSNAAKRLAGLNAILMRSTLRPSAIQKSDKDFYDTMNIYKIRAILKKSKCVRFFIMTADEEANLKAAINMLEMNACDNEDFKIYCSARKTMLNRLIEEQWGDNLELIDDSRTSVIQLKMDSENARHPIDYVDIDTDKAVVTSKFKALIVGFGSTGQDALRFLYEFSAFVGEKQAKSPVEIHVIDNNMSAVKGLFYQEVPATGSLEGKEIFFHDTSAGSMEFNQFLSENIEDLNYVIVSAGNDDVNIEIASMIMDKALQYRNKRMSRFKVLVRMYNEENLIKFNSAVSIYAKFCSDCGYKPLEFFGNTKAIYRKKIIIDNQYEEQAVKFYNSYCTATNDGTSWEQRRKNEIKTFGEIYGRRSLRRKEGQDKANCLHCYTKRKLLNLLGRKVSLPIPEWNIIADKNAQGNPWLMSLYNVSICEHIRWNASHLMMGYVPMTDEVKKQTSGTCDEVTKQHTCIADWEDLSCDTQAYDYAVVRTTVMDS